MEEIAITGVSPREQSPQQENQNHEDKTLGKKRPRRSTSLSPRNSSKKEHMDGNCMNIDKDSKMTTVSISESATTSEGNESLTATAADNLYPPTEDGSSSPMAVGTGISLPRFENGGPLYQRPPSLLWDTPKDMDRSRKGERKRKRTLEDTSATVKHQFAGVAIACKKLGVCAECGIDEQGIDGVTAEPGNVVVLCDGPGCDRELHLKCCRPPLRRVPEGDFYCFDCHPNGGYAVTLLKDYLDEVEARRDAHNEALLEEEPLGKNPLGGESNEALNSPITPSRRTRRLPQSNELTPNTGNSGINFNLNSSSKRKRNCPSDAFTFVDKLIYEDMEENHPDFLSQVMNGIDAEAKGPPRSELDFLHNNKELLVGCAIRLYCPNTNHYQTGRILKFRNAPRTNNDPNNLVTEDYNQTQDTECLVYFPAGRDYRKTSMTRWLRLEEHSLAVASPHLVWGKFASSELGISSSPSSKKKDRWVPTKLWLRSSRELVMSMQLLEESLGQIVYRDFREYASCTTSISSSVGKSPTKESPEKRNGVSDGKRCSFESKSYVRQDWILAECVGRGIYKLVHVSTETVDYCCKDTKESTPSKRESPGKNGKKKSPQKANTVTPKLSTRPRDNEIMLALVHAEQEERNRILSWNKLPLNNAWHKKALTSLSENAIGALCYDDSYNNTNAYGITANGGVEMNEEENTYGDVIERKLVIEPTPLVRTGLDRMYILHQFVKHVNTTQETNGIFAEMDDDKLKPTKDLVLSLSSELVGNHSITSCIQNQNNVSRLRQKEARMEHEKKQTPISLPSVPQDTNSTATTAVATKKAHQETKPEDDVIQIDDGTEKQTATADTVVPKLSSTKNSMVIDLLESPTSSADVSVVLSDKTVHKTNGIANEPVHDANSTVSSTKSSKRKRTSQSKIIPGSTLMEPNKAQTDDRHCLLDETQSDAHSTIEAKQVYSSQSISMPTTTLYSNGVSVSMSQVFENLHEKGET